MISLLIDDWDNGANVFGLVIALNFLVSIGVVYYTYAKIDETGSLEHLENVKTEDVRVNLAFASEYILLVLSSALVIGVSNTAEFSIEQITFSAGAPDSTDNLSDLFFICRIFSMLGAGLVSAALWRTKMHNMVLLLIISCILGVLGLTGLLFAETIGPILLHFSMGLLAINNGVFWVVVPQFIIRYGQLEDFGIDYGINLLANVLGIISLGYAFDIYYNWEGSWDVL